MTNEFDTTIEENIGNTPEVLAAPTPNPPTPTTPEFKLDASAIEVDIDVSSDPRKLRVVSARLRRATKEQLARREAMSLTEIVEANATEDDVVVESERGNAWLFDETVTAVKGFRLASESKELVKEFRPVTTELLDAIYPSYKSAFINGSYNVAAKFFEDEDEGVALGGTETLPVNLVFGDEESPIITLRFELPEPTDTERRNYSNEAVKLRQPKGSRKSRNRIITNINAAVKLFDALMSREGADIYALDSSGHRVTVGGRTLEETKNPLARQMFLDGVDPIYKQKVVSAAMSKYNAKVQD
jgi:hypothetical protein